MWFRRKKPVPARHSAETSTVLGIRIGSYTVRAEEDIESTIDTLLRSEECVATSVAEEGGALLNSFNGQFCAVFPTAPAAYRSARKIVEHPDCLPMQCGMHAGQLYYRGGRVFSSAIGTANRICSYGGNGQIVCSESVAALIRPHLGSGMALKRLDLPTRGLQQALFIVVRAEDIARELRRVFISYRRNGSADMARVVASGLKELGVETFLDVDDLQASHFDDQLLRKIESMANFVPILTPGYLDGGHDAEDWVRKEIAHAIRTGRRIVPLLGPGFRMPSPDALPAEIAELVRYQGVTYSHEFSREALAKLASYLIADCET